MRAVVDLPEDGHHVEGGSGGDEQEIDQAVIQLRCWGHLHSLARGNDVVRNRQRKVLVQGAEDSEQSSHPNAEKEEREKKNTSSNTMMLSCSSVMLILARAVLPFIISMRAAVVYRMAVPIHRSFSAVTATLDAMPQCMELNE